MDMGIRGRKAIVCAASQGLGKACALALANEGVDIVINARGEDALQATAAEIRAASGVNVIAVAADVTTAQGRAALLAACPAPDILVNNAGGPPIGDFRDWDESQWQKAVNDNMVTPIMLIRAVLDGMIERRFGRIVNITSRSVKAPLPHLGLSNGARAGLTGFVGGLARQVANTTSRSTTCCPGRSRRLARPMGSASSPPKRIRTTRRMQRRRWPRYPRTDSANRTSSARRAHSCAAPTLVTSLGRISWWTGARSTRRFSTPMHWLP